MPVRLTYPGVYIEEIPSGVHTITGVATSITAFVGRAAQGPVNKATTINSFADYGRIFGGLSLLSTMSYAVQDFFLNGGSQAIIVRLTNGGTPATITLPEDHTASPPPISSSFTALTLQAASVGSWGSTLTATVDHNTKNPADPTLFNLTVQLFDATKTQLLATQKFLNLSVDPANPRYVVNVLAQQPDPQLVLVLQDGTHGVPGVRPSDTTITVLSPPQTVPGPVSAQPGTDGSALGDGDIIGATNQGNKQGLYALENVDLFNILCIPPYKNLADPSKGNDITTATDVGTAVVAAAGAYCEQRRAFYIVDPPSSWTSKSTAVTQANDFAGNIGTNSDHAAVFFPRINEVNLLHDSQVETFVPCGAVAGIFARTDANRGVWKAPAGQDATLTGVVQLSVPLTDPENGELNPLGVNCLRSFAVIGPVVWGSRTLKGADQLASEWKYIPVRRTALFLEESLYRGTKWVVIRKSIRASSTSWSALRH